MNDWQALSEVLTQARSSLTRAANELDQGIKERDLMTLDDAVIQNELRHALAHTTAAQQRVQNLTPPTTTEPEEPQVGSGTVIAYTDGCSLGNPGRGGYGVFILPPHPDGLLAVGQEVKLAVPLNYLPTNSQAEYEGIIAALHWTVEHGLTHLEIRSDSEFAIRQLKGEYQVKHPNMIPLYREAKRLEARLTQVTYTWVPREQNTVADALSKQAAGR